MKKIICVISFLCSLSCSKSEEPSSTNQISNNPLSPNIPTAPSKNYLQTSYELQKSNVMVDLIKLRKDKLGIDNSWNILAFAYLDVNSDGNDDIFMICSYGKGERTKGDLLINKNGDYVVDNSYFEEIPSMVHARKVLVGDFNGDKMPDIFIAGHGYDYPPFPGEYNQILLSNNKKYKLKNLTEKVGFYHGACSGDIDKDGDLDIFVVDKLNSHFLINDGAGNFNYSTSQIDISNLNGYGICEFFDVDKDGFLDLLIGGGDVYNPTRIYWGSSSYKFELNNKTDFPTVTDFKQISDIDVADLDGDNINEVIVNRTGFENFYNGWYIQVITLRNKIATDASTTFIDNNKYLPAVPDNQQWIPWLRFGDVDNNGKPDLFSVRCSPIQAVRWELQNKKLIRVY